MRRYRRHKPVSEVKTSTAIRQPVDLSRPLTMLAISVSYPQAARMAQSGRNIYTRSRASLHTHGSGLLDT